MPPKADWSGYRKFYVADRLAAGWSRAKIAQALGLSRGAVEQGIMRHGLTKALFCPMCSEQLTLDGKCRHCAFEEWDAARRAAQAGRAGRA